MAELDRNTIAKLRKLLPMLASNHAGEVVATAAAVLRTLEGAGASLHDLVAMIDKPARVVEKVAYRDRIVIEEKVVYRDREPAPPHDAERDALSSKQVLETGRKLLTAAFLHDNERSFVENMVARAELDGNLFAMTAKQQVWFRDLVARRPRSDGFFSTEEENADDY